MGCCNSCLGGCCLHEHHVCKHRRESPPATQLEPLSTLRSSYSAPGLRCGQRQYELCARSLLLRSCRNMPEDAAAASASAAAAVSSASSSTSSLCRTA
eukprot:SAG31_NODE_1773_length_7304_cov_2.180380_8_plen_98_part_00